MKQHKQNCFEKTKVRWGIFKKLSPTKLHSEQSALLAANVSVLYDVADFQQENLIRSTKVELSKMFNRRTSAAILYSTC